MRPVVARLAGRARRCAAGRVLSRRSRCRRARSRGRVRRGSVHDFANDHLARSARSSAGRGVADDPADPALPGDLRAAPAQASLDRLGALPGSSPRSFRRRGRRRPGPHFVEPGFARRGARGDLADRDPRTAPHALARRRAPGIRPAPARGRAGPGPGHDQHRPRPDLVDRRRRPGRARQRPGRGAAGGDRARE